MPLFHSDSLRPLVVDCMRLAVQGLAQRLQQPGGQQGEVRCCCSIAVWCSSIAFASQRLLQRVGGRVYNAVWL
jgi:hypothetical protein